MHFSERISLVRDFFPLFLFSPSTGVYSLVLRPSDFAPNFASIICSTVAFDIFMTLVSLKSSLRPAQCLFIFTQVSNRYIFNLCFISRLVVIFIAKHTKVKLPFLRALMKILIRWEWAINTRVRQHYNG